MSYQTIQVERRGRTVLLRLHRPEALNVINAQMAAELIDAATVADAVSDIGCMVLTGTAQAFAAGADVKEMADRSYADMYASDWFAQWDKFTSVRKPIIAVVAGYALGGGCELAMMCDFIIAADTRCSGSPRSSWESYPEWGKVNA